MRRRHPPRQDHLSKSNLDELRATILNVMRRAPQVMIVSPLKPNPAPFPPHSSSPRPRAF